jgi:hypothetical protein
MAHEAGSENEMALCYERRQEGEAGLSIDSYDQGSLKGKKRTRAEVTMTRRLVDWQIQVRRGIVPCCRDSD